MTRKEVIKIVEWTVYIAAIITGIWLFIILVSGCAVFSSLQTETTKEGTTRETKIRVYTLFDAQSDLTKLRASTTEKTQGLTLAGLTESSTSTNAVHMLQLIAQIVAAAK